MSVEVVTPEDYMGDVIGDLNARRGRVGQMENRGTAQVIDAEVPLSGDVRYANDLRSRTRASYLLDAVRELPASPQHRRRNRKTNPRQ